MQLKGKILRYLVTVTLVCISFALQARIQYVTVDSEGVGSSQQEAINDALVNAISEINGVEVASKTNLKTSEISNNEIVESTDSFKQSINKKTNGLIKEYVVLNKQQSEFSKGSWSATVRATIAKYDVSKQSKRLRVAVLPFTINENIPDWKKPEEFNKNITQTLVSYMTQTRKFAMLDREHMAAQSNELAMLHTGNTPVEELTKLGQRLSTDYIIVGDIDDIHYHKNNKQLKMSGKTITTIKQGARVSYQIIDVATGQIKFSDLFDKILFSSKSRVSSVVVAEKTASEIGSVITNAIYPIRVEAIKDKDIFIGQGGKTLHKGDEYSLVMLGEVLKDSYTGESLGREEKNVGTVKIIQVQAKQSQAKIVRSTVDADKLFKPGLFILRPYKKASEVARVSFKRKEKDTKASVETFEKSLSSDW
jgi:curli biogenesis system outer membrane secretion channel CsgG